MLSSGNRFRNLLITRFKNKSLKGNEQADHEDLLIKINKRTGIEKNIDDLTYWDYLVVNFDLNEDTVTFEDIVDCLKVENFFNGDPVMMRSLQDMAKNKDQDKKSALDKLIDEAPPEGVDIEEFSKSL